jgi:putative transposase
MAAQSSISALLAAIKRPCSVRIKQAIVDAQDDLLRKPTVLERPGKTAFRFWQEGSGYDRNLQSEASVMAAIEYIHNNPVRRGLCARAVDWYWSSARFYATVPPQQDSRPPLLTKLPPELFG